MTGKFEKLNAFVPREASAGDEIERAPDDWITLNALSAELATTRAHLEKILESFFDEEHPREFHYKPLRARFRGRDGEQQYGQASMHCSSDAAAFLREEIEARRSIPRGALTAKEMSAEFKNAGFSRGEEWTLRTLEQRAASLGSQEHRFRRQSASGKIATFFSHEVCDDIRHEYGLPEKLLPEL